MLKHLSQSSLKGEDKHKLPGWTCPLFSSGSRQKSLNMDLVFFVATNTLLSKDHRELAMKTILLTQEQLGMQPFNSEEGLWDERITEKSQKIQRQTKRKELSAAAKSLQSCPTLCDPIDGSPPGSPVPGILQARTLEWVAISFSDAWKWKVKVKLLSRVRLLATPWTAAYQAAPSMGFSRQEYWSGVPLPSPERSYLVISYFFQEQKTWPETDSLFLHLSHHLFLIILLLLYPQWHSCFFFSWDIYTLQNLPF